MRRRVDFILTADQLTVIEQAINYSPRSEMRQRAIAIRLLHLGHTPDQVGKMVPLPPTPSGHSSSLVQGRRGGLGRSAQSGS